jgi:hypothetical protein
MFGGHGWNSRKQSRKQSRLGIESLETRTVMDGNLSAILAGGTLTIVGDSAANVATLSSNEDGELVLTGFDTTINEDSEAASFCGVKNIVVRLNGGDDVFTVANGTECMEDVGNASPATINANLSIRGGEGDDTVTVVADIVGSLNLAGNGGDDSISIHESYLAYNVTLDGGLGDDNLSLTSSLLDRSATLEGGMGGDTLSIDGTEVARDVTFNGSSGDDMIKMTGTSARHLQVWGGSGDDIMEIRESEVVTLSLWGSNGDDEATLDEVDVSDLLFADLGNGDDLLAISSTNAAWSILWGGWGNDAFENGPGNNLGPRWSSGF